jgi:DNA (cytosine-5)-methyltransferase 1
MAVWYNEIDPFAAAWLRELIREGHIADGVVDERSIADVAPVELSGFAQCHFFAGIGVWSHALRKAGWPDDRPVWTGSCPCQPFSAAGARAGFDDERHVWPFWHWLIAECRPPIVLGEQVASVDGLGWLDLVSADLEGTDYAFGAADLCAAGVGAPHIRQRLWFVAHANDARLEGRQLPAERAGECATGSGSASGRLADAGSERRQQDARGASGDEAANGRAGRNGRKPDRDHLAASDVQDSRLADADRGQCRGIAVVGGDERDGQDTGRPQERGQSEPRLADGGRLADAGSQRREGQPVRLQPGQSRQAGVEAAGGGSAGRLADAASISGSVERENDGPTRLDGGTGDWASGGNGSGNDTARTGELPPRDARENGSGPAVARPGAADGFWRDCDWLLCRDGKWRPVESGTFPLVAGAAARVGRLRGYGNALNAEAARTFIEAVM